MHLRTLLGALPLIALVLLVIIRCGRRGLRIGVLEGYMIWGCTVFLLTELLSLLRLLTFPVVATAWTVTVAGLVCWLIRPSNVRYRHVLSRILTLARTNKIVAIFLTAILGVTLVIALSAPPNNWDSMTTYMTRVANWIQNRHVGHYPAYHDSQAISPPLASHMILHLQILAGGDRLANLIQWASMVGVLFGVGAITKELGGSDAAAGVAVLFVATIPMGILQATSTQTDYAASLWTVIFVHYLLRNLRSPGALNHIPEGVALGLAALTKYTALFVALPFAMWQAFTALRQQRFRAVGSGLIVAAILLALNAPHIARNVSRYGHPLASGKSMSSNKNERFGPDVTLSNLLRNTSLHLATVKSANRVVVNAINKAHDLLGLDAAMTGTSVMDEFGITSFNTHEDTTGNLLHLVLIVIALVAAGAISSIRMDARRIGYALSLVAGVLVFCSYLKWSPWKGRLHLPWFVLFGPLVALVIDRLSKRWVRTGLSMVLVAGAVPWLIFNATRPLLSVPGLTKGRSVLTAPRMDQYFINRKQLQEQYVAAVEALKRARCRNIALVRGRNGWEYPFWVLAHQKLGDFTIRKPLAANPKDKVHAAKIDAWIYVGSAQRTIKANPRLGRKIHRSPYVRVFLPKSRSAQD